MLKETYIANMSRVDGYKIVVSRWYPRGIKRSRFDEWLPVLGPSRKLLRDYKTGKVTWAEYTRRYYGEILGSPAALKEILRIQALARDRDVYLVCWEREPPCHRFLLLQLAKDPDKLKETLNRLCEE